MHLPIEIQRQLNHLADKYARLFSVRIGNELEKIRATGELEESVTVHVQKATAHSSPEILVKFAPHGDYIGKKKLLFTKLVPGKKLVDWMNAEGITPSRIPGYKNGAPNLTDEQKRERFAFAIGKDKKVNDTWKRKQWKRKALTETLKRLNVEIIAAYTREVEQIMAREISNVR